jgi:hypothetical protein
LEIADPGSPEPVPIRDQDHGRVPVPVTARLAGGSHQGFDLGTGQVFPGPGTGPRN